MAMMVIILLMPMSLCSTALKVVSVSSTFIESVSRCSGTIKSTSRRQVQPFCRGLHRPGLPWQTFLAQETPTDKNDCRAHSLNLEV